MPDKKLTDSEIIKALEESISFDEPYESDFTLIRIEYIKNALDLINRLQAENETLRNVVEQKHIIRKDGKSPLSLTKAEAYKEFAERLKAEYADFDEKYEVILPENIQKTIADLLRELVGGDNEQSNT